MKTSYSFPPNQRKSSHSALFILVFISAAVVVTAMAGGIVKAHPGPSPGPSPGALPGAVVVDSIEPTEIVQGQVPQPTLQILGSNFIEGLPSKTNRPTVTLRQQGKGGAEFSALAFVNFQATVATLPADIINLLQAPLGVYDVIVTRPTDNASATLKGGFTVTDGEPGSGEIALLVRSAWGGPVNDVEVVGNLAYAAIGRRLVILNVADPTNPFEVGSLNIMAGVEGVAVRDGYAFLAAHKPYKFCVVDVSDPTDPTLVWAGQGDQFSHDVHLYGNLAYVRAITGDLDVLDITNPNLVVSLGGVPVGDGVAAMAIVGDILYVGKGVACCAQLQIYDLASDPLNPVLLGSVDNVGTQTTALAVEGEYAYWTVRHTGGPEDNWSSLEVVDVSNPRSPAIVASETGFVWARDVAVSGGYAYVADTTTNVPHQGLNRWASTLGLGIFDVSDPTNPTLVSTFKTHGNVTGVEIVGNRAYVHDDGEGLIILDVTDPTKPVRLGNYHSPAVLRQMAKEGDLLYVVDAWNGFTILNVADPAHPEVVSVYMVDHLDDLGIDAWGIDVQDNLVYLGAGHLGLELVDVSEPASPALVGAFRIPPPAVAQCGAHFAAVKVWSDDPRYASIGFEDHRCGSAGHVFLNLDVSDPANIFELGRANHSYNHASEIVLNRQGIAFISRRTDRSELTIDTSNPAGPIIINQGDNHSPPRLDDILVVADLALDGNTLFLAASDDAAYLDKNDKLAGTFEPGLYIQDVTDPANPVLLAYVGENYPLGGGIAALNEAYAIAVRGDRLYVVSAGCEPPWCGTATYLFDVSDPMSPLVIDAVLHTGGRKSAVHVDEPFVYVTTEFDGPTAPNIGLVVMEVMGLNPVGDLDGDGSVGVKDLLILLGEWGPCDDCTDCPADLDGDCTVGVKDLLILLGNWG